MMSKINSKKCSSLIDVLTTSISEEKGITFINNNTDDIFMSYKELYDRALNMLYHMISKGLKAGSELVFQIEDNKQFLITFWACILGGIIPVPVTIGTNDEHKEKLLRIWKILKSPYLISNKNIIEKLTIHFETTNNSVFKEELSNKLLDFEDLCGGDEKGTVHTPNQNDIAFIQFSSGSTGDPKGVILTHQNLITNIYAIINCSQTTSEDSTLAWMPLTHDMGLIGFHLAPMTAGINQYIMTTVSFIRNPIQWMNKVEEYKATTLASPNFGYKHFLTFLSKYKDKNWDLSHVRLIFNGAEPISAELSDVFYHTMSKWGMKKTAAFPVYGLAEASLAVTFSMPKEGLSKKHLDRSLVTVGEKIKFEEEQKDNTVTFVDLGYPVDDCYVRICDWDNNLLEENTIGQIQIKGKNVTRGYYNNEIETKRIILEDGWLNTGDIGFIRNGRLSVTGRAKDIIFINGQNFYPHDLERIVSNIKGAELGKVAICGAYNNEKQKEEILAFVLNKGSLEDFVHISLGIKKIINSKASLEVSSVIPVKKMAKTTSGKVQRYKLKEEYEQGLYNAIKEELELLEKLEIESRDVIAPTNELEEKLVKIWSDILKIKNIGIYDNFFELGGDSLKATYIAANIYKEIGIEVPLNQLFSEPTIKTLAECAVTAEKVEYKTIDKIDKSSSHPVSPAQKRMYVMYEIERQDTSYNITHVMKVKGSIDSSKLDKAIRAITNRHEILRTHFEIVNGEPVQVVNEDIEPVVEYIKMKRDEINNGIRSFVKPFNLNKAPLSRIAVVETEDKEQILVFDAHHIIFDGTSVAVLFEEFFNLYEGHNISEPTVQYKDYVCWYSKKLEEDNILEQEKYWLEMFSGELPVLEMPLDFTRPAIQSYEGDKKYFSIDKILCEKLKQLALKTGTSIYMVLMSSYFVLLNKYTAQEDIIVGTPTVGRNHPELYQMIGMFVNTLALRNKINEEKSFEHLLGEIKSTTLTAFEKQDYQFEKLVEKLNIQRDMGHNPIFDTMFVFQNMMIKNLKNNDFELEEYKYKNNISKFDLTLFAQWDNDEIQCELEYCTKLFKDETIQQISNHYINILNEIADQPQKTIKTINMLTENEKNRLLNEFNNTKKVYPQNATIHKLFEEQVNKNPYNIAIEFEGERLTYAQVNNKADKLANLLRSKGIEKQSIIGIMSERMPKAIIAILAVLKAGAVYLPIDTEYPKERIKFMLEDSDVALVLTQTKFLDSMPIDIKALDLESEELFIEHSDKLEELSTSDDLAYIIYTSGSTGKPKGAMLSHKGVVNYTTWAAKSYLKGESLAFPLYTSISFDLTVTSIFTPLITGNRIIIYGEDDKKLSIEKVLEDNKAGVIKLTPAHLKLIKEKDLSFSKVKRLIVGGEQLETTLANKIHKCFDEKVEIYNEYGPTEATVGCMIYRYDANTDKRIAVPIGVPADNMEIYILDKHLNPVPQNSVGEMYIGGIGLAKGYINREDLTNDRFIDNPFKDGHKIYKTGDLARLMWDGNIEFVGRKDHQVKIRGYRIELGEIEEKLLQYKDIREAVVIENNDIRGNNYLCAYIISEKELKQEEIRSFMKYELPEYMIPSYFVQIHKLPLTINGKIDTKKLPEPINNISVSTEYIAPATNIEEELVKVWTEILGVDRIGINDNYFSLGGDSIKAIQIVSKLNQKKLSVRVKDILTYQTIKDLCLNVDFYSDIKTYSQETLEGNVELLPIHNWFMNQDFNNPNHFNQSVMLKLNKDIEANTLKSAFKVLINHHDGLRINYNKSANILYYNENHQNCDVDIKEFNISHLDENQQKTEISSIGNSIKSSFDIEKGLLIKCAMITTTNEKYFLITAHHIVIDGVSWMILLEDLFKLVEAYGNKTNIELPNKTASINDWKNELIDYSKSKKFEQEKKYWQGNSCEEFNAQNRNIYHNKSNGNIKKIIKTLEEEKTQKLLTECHKTYNTEINDLLLTALAKTISEWKQKREVVLELEGHGRTLENVDVSRTIGWFTSMYPVRIMIENQDMGLEIKSIKEQLRNIRDNNIGYGILKYINYLSQNMKAEIPEIRFNYLGQFDNLIDSRYAEYVFLDTGINICPTNNPTANIEINCMVVKGTMDIEINYNSELYAYEDINYVANSFLNNLDHVINHTLEQDDIYFTPSDFDTLDIGQDDLDSLFE